MSENLRLIIVTDVDVDVEVADDMGRCGTVDRASDSRWRELEFE